MPSVLASTEIVIGMLLVVAVVVLATTYLRRRYIAKGLPLTLCGMRRTESDRWRLGLIRFGDNALEWYALGGVSVRPKHRWLRQRLLLDAPEPLSASDSIPLLPDASRVPCSDGGSDFELALQGPAYTALRSWQEAAPPGYNVNVA
ncbi:DUF2550 domain-containing protein [Terrabacter sp. Ter38]|uniref:DUF2550 domain-containing protein n=1 Tax=Terrabacter sp. Ter38 TaxID=2926030 RepID=UPI00211848B9|nr:DUF2550 domain-containing protein [Terrabacter sp. Ter38]